MVDVTPETAESLEKLAEDNEVELETVQETFKEKLEEVDEKAVGDVDDEKRERFALRMTRNAQLVSRVPVDAVEMLTIGGSVRDWNSGDTFVGTALVDINPNEDAGRDYLASVIIDGDDVNLAEVQDAFSEVGNVVVGEFSISEAHTDKFRVLNSSSDTEIDVTRPDDRSPMIQAIRDAVPETSIDEISDNLSQTERSEDGDLFAAAFGVDIRRMEVDIFDGYKNPSRGTGIYTVRDNTVFDEDDIVESPVFDASDANENATPGMTCFVEPSQMKYASGSVVEMYGVLQKNDDGIINMSVDGMIPIIVEGDFDGYEDNSSDESPEREESSSNVAHTSI